MRTKSVPIAILFFWVFSTLPRIFYFYEERIVQEGLSLVLPTLVDGFLRDSVLAALLLIAFQLVYFLTGPFSFRLNRTVHTVVTVSFAALIALMMANVEFFRYFGSNATLTHLTFISDTEIMTPSLSSVFPMGKLFFICVLVPGVYILLNFTVSNWQLDQWLKSSKGLFFSIPLLIAGLAVHKFSKESDPLKKNLADNYVISFLKYSALGDDVQGKPTESIAKILDTLPIKSDKIISPEWHYFDPKYPLAQATAHHLCGMGLWDASECAKDLDKDGYPLKTDCNDLESSIHPGARDIPGNSIDDDCSGIDADPPNIILIHWEGARAVNVGSIGYFEPSTPRFDELAKRGLLFNNAYANGTQTRWSITSVYNSILPRLSTKWIFKHNPDLNLMAYPRILRDFGYQSIYIHGGDSDFGNFKKRFWEWFETTFDRFVEPIRSMKFLGWGATDKDVFQFAYKYLDQRKDSRPFYLTIATLSLHHPFLLPDEKYELQDHTVLKNRIPNILRYSDEQLGWFVNKILSNPKFKNTVIIIAADHGLNMYAPHGTGTQSTLWEDLVWVPILLIGDAWNVKPGINSEVRQLADIGPTILDRLGIQMPNHFIGHTLLRHFESGREPKAFFGNANGGISAGVRMGRYKYFASLDGGKARLYDMVDDREERNNLINDPDQAERVQELSKMLMDVQIQNTRLIQENAIWNWKFSKKK